MRWEGGRRREEYRRWGMRGRGRVNNSNRVRKRSEEKEVESGVNIVYLSPSYEKSM